MANKVILKDKDGNQILPLTTISQVVDETGTKSIVVDLNNINNSITNITNELTNIAKKNINNHFISGQTIEGDLFVNGYLNLNTADYTSARKVATIIDTYRSSDGITWTRTWSDGWKECGGYVTTSGTSLTLTLPVTFSDTNYTIVTSEWEPTSTDTEGVDYNFMLSDKTVNTVRVSKASARCILFYACGY